MLGRVDNLASAATGGTVYAGYGYLGSGVIAKIEHPQVTNNLVLNYDPSANGTFAALDQFGQVVDQKWTVNGSAIDEYTYGMSKTGTELVLID